MNPTPGRALHGGTNLPRVSDFNQTVVLEAIRRARHGLSRVELARATGLSAQTVSNIVRRLLEQSLVMESGKVQKGMGKPRTVIRLNPGSRFSIGVHLDPAVMTFVILDLSGQIAAQTRCAVPALADPDTVVELMGSTITSLLTSSGVERGHVVGIGLAAPGPIDPDPGIIFNPPHLQGWRTVPLRESLSTRTGLPVLLEKDVAAAAVAEVWGGQGAAADSFIFVYLGTGIGMGLVSEGQVIRGPSHNAGEVGHIIVDPDGPACFCGLRGCVGTACVPAYLVEEARAAGLVPSAPAEPDGQEIPCLESAFATLCSAAAAGEDAAISILQRSATRLARAVSVLANALDIDRIVFGGPFWPQLADIYLAVVPEALKSLMVASFVHPVRVEGTVFGMDVAAVGAACSVFNDALSPRTDRLLLNRELLPLPTGDPRPGHLLPAQTHA